MKDHNYPTVQKDHKLKWSSEHSRKAKKSIKKRMDSVLTTVSEGASIELTKDLIDTSSIFQVLDENQLDESPQSSVNSVSAAAAVSPSVASAVSDLSVLNSTITSDTLSIASDFSPLPSTITSNKIRTDIVKVNHTTADSGEIVKGESLKAEIFARNFRQAGTQSLKANNMILLSENVMEVLLRDVIEDLHNLPEKRDRFTAIVEKQVYIVLKKVLSVILTFILLIITVGVLVLSAGDAGSYHELVPT